MAPLTSKLFNLSVLFSAAISVSYGAEFHDWKDKLNRHVANKNPNFVNTRFLQSTAELPRRRSGEEIAYDDPDMQMLQRGAINGFDFTDTINAQFEETILKFQAADKSTVIQLFQNIELLQGSETYQTMVVDAGKNINDMNEAELRQLAVGSIRDTKDASTELVAYTKLTEQEKEEKVQAFKGRNSELSGRIENGDYEAYQEMQAKFQKEEITSKYDSSALTSDDKLRKRQQGFKDDSQLRMALGDEELLAIMDSPNLSFYRNQEDNN